MKFLLAAHGLAWPSSGRRDSLPSGACLLTVHLTVHVAVPAEAQGFMGERAGSQDVEVDASHAVSVSHPAAVARLIDEAARATTR